MEDKCTLAHSCRCLDYFTIYSFVLLYNNSWELMENCSVVPH